MELKLRVGHASKDEKPQIAAWLAQESMWNEALMLPAEPDAAWVDHDMLMIFCDQRIELAPARFWSARLLADDKLVGFAIDYRWQPGNDAIRELDIALPGLSVASPRMAVELYTRVVHALYRDAGAQEVRSRRRASHDGRYDRLFSLAGMDLFKMRHDVHPVSGVPIERAYYHGTYEKFQLSRWGRRMLAEDK